MPVCNMEKNKKGIAKYANISIIALILFILVLMNGCTSGGTSSAKGTNLRTGTKGLEASFAEGSPPSTIYDGNSVPLNINIWNKGAESASGTLYFDGFDPGIVSIPTQVFFPAIDGTEATKSPQGGYYLVQVGNFAPMLPEDTDNYAFSLRATLCYDYKTAASVQICIDADPSKTGSKACTPANPSLGGGQGGPVAISAVQQDSSIGQTVFKITVRNVGGGRVISQAKVGQCNSLSYADYDEVQFSGVISNGQPLDCGSNTKARLINNEATIICKTTTNPSRGAYSTILKINLNYGYTYSNIKNIEVRRI
ncbi:MAG: hypothetical protein NTV63_04325 [Candidatus Woesearchaeota archaeon]|nr:hypothetical protein [Candidatus Woesearchaeota archaeon]